MVISVVDPTHIEGSTIAQWILIGRTCDPMCVHDDICAFSLGRNSKVGAKYLVSSRLFDLHQVVQVNALKGGKREQSLLRGPFGPFASCRVTAFFNFFSCGCVVLCPISVVLLPAGPPSEPLHFPLCSLSNQTLP